MAGKIYSVGMLILMQHDLEAAVTFYQNLGFRLRFHIKKQWAEFELNGVKIGLCPVEKELPDRRTGMVFNVDDLHAFYESHKDTLTFASEPVERVHGIMIGLKDPGNNYIDLYQPTPEKVQEVVEKARQEGERAEQDCPKGQECCQQKNSAPRAPEQA